MFDTVVKVVMRLMAVTMSVAVAVAVFVVEVMAIIVAVEMLVVMVTLVALMLQSPGGGGLVAGGEMEPVLLLQLPPGLVPLPLQLGHHAPDELLLEEDGVKGERGEGVDR